MVIHRKTDGMRGKIEFVFPINHAIIQVEYQKNEKSTGGIIMDEQLIAAAKEEMRLHSVKFTMDDIARKLHISKSTLYQKASSKAVLIRMVCLADQEAFRKAKEALMMKKDTARGRLLSYCRLFVETLWAMPDGFYQDIEIHYPEIWKMWMDFKYEEFDYMMELLEAGVAAGAFREVNLTILRMILITSTHNLNDADFLREQNMTGTDVMNVLEDIILHGIEK